MRTETHAIVAHANGAGLLRMVSDPDKVGVIIASFSYLELSILN